jgi:predicted kinase
MKLKEIITEAVILDNISSINVDLHEIKKNLVEQLIIEGVDDPGILKMVFMAGGPGSGKGRMSQELLGIFGIDQDFAASFSDTGLKVVNSDTAYVAGLKRNGIDPKDLAKIEKENPELWDMISGKRTDSIRSKAKKLTAKQRKFFEIGRLGMVIDGTGKDYSKLKKQKEEAEKMGYDTYMIFVDCSLEVAKIRNLSRDRVVPEDILVSSWHQVQDNKSKFKSLFGGSFEYVDNTTYDKHAYEYRNPNSGKINIVQKAVAPPVRAAIAKFVKKPIFNKIGKEWIKATKKLKKLKMIDY